MRYFYADSLDLVDPTFDFVGEESVRGRIPQRDDIYAHQLYAPDRPYDGILVSKWLVDGHGGQSRYSQAQRQRFLRDGAQRFLRFPADGSFDPEQHPILGDCGAFNYAKEVEPPFAVNDVVEFYQMCGFTHGLSVDHMILDYGTGYDDGTVPVPEEARRRSELTQTLAAEFLQTCSRDRVRFQAIGVAQGWSPKSYASSVRALAKMGYDYVALGSMVPLKTPDIQAVLSAVRDETQGQLRLHLLGITRLEAFTSFADAGVVSLDSTSPLRQGVKEGIYYGDGGPYMTVRIPQTDVYPKLINSIRSGFVRQEDAMRAERESLEMVAAFDTGAVSADALVTHLQKYESMYGGKSPWNEVRRTLAERPWNRCPCGVCRALGIQVVVFRGANRNRRRGFHNLWYTHQQLTALRTERQQESA